MANTLRLFRNGAVRFIDWMACQGAGSLTNSLAVLRNTIVHHEDAA